MASKKLAPLSRLLVNSSARLSNLTENVIPAQKKTESATLFNSQNAVPAYPSLESIPGPKPSIPFIGTAWQYFPGGRYELSKLHEACVDKYNRYGPIVKEEFQWRKPVVHLYNPEDFQTVHTFQGPFPMRPISEFVKHYRSNNPHKYSTVGLANSVGEEWDRLRKLLGPVLLQLDSMDRLVPDINTICDDFVDLIKTERNGETLHINDLQDYVYRLALEAIYMMSLDTRLGCLEKTVHPDSPASRMIFAVKMLFEAFQELYYGLPLWKLFPTPAYMKLDKAESVMYDASNSRINDVILQLRKEGTSRTTPLSTMINSNMTDKEISVTVIDFISGGIFTVTNAVSFLLYHIARNPDVQEKLYKEVRDIMPDSVITPERLSQLRYLKACVKESFRLTPTIPTITRILPDPIVAAGYYIPKETPIFCNIIVPCMRPEKFPEPHRYLPDRWMTRNTQPFTLMPFGFGKRMCIGRRFSEMEIYSVLAKLVCNFKLESTGQEIQGKYQFIIVPSEPISIVFKDRKK